MRGHERLIRLRLAGYVPDWVWLDTDPDRMQSWRDWDEIDPRNAAIEIEEGDRAPDLRCVVGLKCWVCGTRVHRVHRIRDACIAAGAERVVAVVTERFGAGEFVAFRLIESTDTAGLCNIERDTPCNC